MVSFYRLITTYLVLRKFKDSVMFLTVLRVIFVVEAVISNLQEV